MSKINCQNCCFVVFGICFFKYFFCFSKRTKYDKILYVTLSRYCWVCLDSVVYFWRQNSGCLLQSAFLLSIYWIMVSNTPSPNTITWISLISFSTFFLLRFFYIYFLSTIFFHCTYLCVYFAFNQPFNCTWSDQKQSFFYYYLLLLLLSSKRSPQKQRKFMKIRQNDRRWRAKNSFVWAVQFKKNSTMLFLFSCRRFSCVIELIRWFADRVCFLLKTFQSGKSTADKTNWCFYTVRRSTRICWNIFYFHTPYDREADVDFYV